MTRACRVVRSFVFVLIALSASTTLAQTPTKEGFIDAGNGVKLYYRLLGAGSDPVVLIHGGPGLTSDYLADDLTTMARNHSLLVYDQRGIGRSTLVSDSTALAAQRYVEDLEAIRKHLGREQAAAMPNARLLELKGIGHFPYVEAPEVFFPAVDQFLRGDWPQGAIR